jgi:hypothetical protein
MKRNNPPVARSPRRATFLRGATTAAFLGCLALSSCLFVGGCAGETKQDAKVDGVDRAALTPTSLEQRLANIDKLNLTPQEKEELKRHARELDAAQQAQAAQYKGGGQAPAGGGQKPPAGYVVPAGTTPK